MKKSKKKILIADDSEINRSILSDMLKDEFDIIEACNGVEAVAALKKYGEKIAIVLLDIVMPQMDGFEVLAVMNKNHWIEDIPVIMITAENTPAYVERAYDLGITDFISRPFDGRIVHRRTVNTIMLYYKQKKLIGLVSDQIYEKEKQSNLMIEILSNIVEFRNGESGLHVLRIHILTEVLLNQLLRKTDKYKLTRADVSLIGIASALHDIGKIVIPDEVLNKPGRLTKEEFEAVKKHSAAGAAMLKNLPFRQNEPLVKVAYQICRWHHERYDGKGYPDGLVGDDIPIAAQVVALADVYDALVSKRVYKDAYTHEEALKMIFGGECGAFNPLLLDCLKDIADVIQTELKINSLSDLNKIQVRNITNEMIKHEELSASERTLHLLEHERTKYKFFASMSNEIQFEYAVSPSMVTISESGAKQLGLPEFVMNPAEDSMINKVFKPRDLQHFAQSLKATTPDSPVIQCVYEMRINDSTRWCRVIARSMWSSDDVPQYVGAIGKLVDITDEQQKLIKLEQMAHHDALTGLLNRDFAKKMICSELQQAPQEKCAAIILDLDFFKQVNDNYGHLFGDEVLKFVAQRIEQVLRPQEIAARVGGDEFLLFIRADSDIEHRVEHIFRFLSAEKDAYRVSLSMGISLSCNEDCGYEFLFHQADQALYASKRAGRGTYRFYDDGMKDMFSVISPIDGE